MADIKRPTGTFYNREIETLPREEIKRIQFEGIKRLLNRAYHTNSFYRRHLDAAGVTPESIRSLDDYRERVPFLTKADLVRDQEEAPPFGTRLMIPEEDVRLIHMTSGTSGLGQELYVLTEDDVSIAGKSLCYHLAAVGIEKGDFSGVFWPVGTMTGGLLAAAGLRELGINGMLLHLQDSQAKLRTLTRFSAHHFWATPAYLTRLTVLCKEMGIDPRRDLPRLKCITLSTESFPAEWAVRMEEFWGCTVHDTYGSTQYGLAYAYTCDRGAVPEGKRGVFHLLETTALVEILDPATGKHVEYGEVGEPVVTTFYRQGAPLIRFRQGDLIRHMPPEACPCGRTSDTWEVGTIGRIDDMIKMKATNVWPQAVDGAVFAYPEVDEYNGRVFIDEKGRERVAIALEFCPDVADVEAKQRILSRLIQELKEKVGVTMEVEEVPLGTVRRFEYKVRRWTDEREKGLRGI